MNDVIDASQATLSSPCVSEMIPILKVIGDGDP
jgi:hypothetical protein